MKGALLAGGGSSEVFAWGSDRVVKLFRPQYAGAVEAEHERARAVFAAGAPCPAVHERVEIEGRAGIVFDRVDGPLLIERVREAPEEVGRRLGALHVEIHRLPGRGLPSVRELALGANARLPGSERARHRRWVDALPEGDQLAHGDFHPGNVILSETGPVVVDWPNAAAGAPGVDVARSWVLMRFGIGEDRHARNLAARLAMRRALTDAYLDTVLAGARARREDFAAALPIVADAILRQVPDHPHEADLRALIGDAESGKPR